MKKTIALDMDQVLADLVQEKLDRFNKKYDKQLTKKDMIGLTLVEKYPELKDEIYQMVNTYDFFRHLPVIEHSQEVVQELSEHYDIFIATAAMFAPESLQAKYEWLREHFSFIPPHNFIFCGVKSIVHTDYLIDDSLEQLEIFKGQGIMFSAPHNRYEDFDVKLDDWLHVRDYFMTAISMEK
ncbi:5'(3')-deoxyribonucleotidase [Cerasibacillus quisquiliarum]|uniref:Putative 5'(3')-deoxyribonucleotidase n=1 Tax=Cerasibacillus quisquiliarum TaxID=227865 RepID=A0A511UZF4_9BACI|nr:5'-3'-deoxyribonucleotidase [Cerasibacillus quisquiliarum]MBB5146109.1 5'(3')-deoxyribonucleotidase [Cerasibacillus quisquiliarum]GEN30843.1 putative 5'(3')-deoxyribonucleotidase [Cerasibacillus quisquiliarum]